MSAIDVLSPRFPPERGDAILDRFCIKDVLPLATDVLSVQYYARQRLRRRLVDCLEDVFEGISMVLDVLEEEDAVIAGQFVFWFLEETKAREGLTELDLFVRKGGSDSLVLKLQEMSDVDTVMLSATRRPGPEDEGDGMMGRDGEYYGNEGIFSIVRMRFENTHGDFVTVVVTESVSPSCLTPILYFESTQMKLALAGHAFIAFHSKPCSEASGGLVVSTATKLFFKTYVPDNDAWPGKLESDVPAAAGDHICYESDSCPLTYRRTTDSGVLFIPLTEQAAVDLISRVPRALNQPPVRWRVGGECVHSVGERVDIYVKEEECCESGSPVV